MVQKRPYDAEEMLEVSFKHPKQAEPSNQLVSYSQSVIPENSSQIPETSGVGLIGIPSIFRIKFTFLKSKACAPLGV